MDAIYVLCNYSVKNVIDFNNIGAKTMKFAFLLVATITGLVLEITTVNAQSIYGSQPSIYGSQPNGTGNGGMNYYDRSGNVVGSSQPNGTGNGGTNYYDHRAYDNEVRDALRALGR